LYSVVSNYARANKCSLFIYIWDDRQKVTKSNVFSVDFRSSLKSKWVTPYLFFCETAGKSRWIHIEHIELSYFLLNISNTNKKVSINWW
jgi:hypothetical protein